MNSQAKGGILIVVAMLMSATQAVIIRDVSLKTPVFLFYFESFFLVFTIAYMLFSKDVESFKPHHPPVLVFFSVVLLVIVQITYYSALRMTSFANAMFTHYTAPIFALVIAIIFMKEKFEWQSLVAIIVSMLGIGVIVFANISGNISFTRNDLFGIILGLASGLIYGILINVNKKFVSYGHILSLFLYQTIPMVIIYSPFFFVQTASIGELVMIMVAALIPGIIASLVYFEGIKAMKAQHIGIISYSELIFVIIFGFIFFKEIPSLMTCIGGSAIILSGIWIILLENGKENEKNNKFKKDNDNKSNNKSMEKKSKRSKRVKK